MTIHKCDRCKKEAAPLSVIKIKDSFELCVDCIKQINDFIKYCRHGNSIYSCEKCEEEI